MAGYYIITTSLINRFAEELSRPSAGSIYLFLHSGHKTQFLIYMGSRAIPAVKRQLDSPDINLHEKIHLAWILSCIGDYSYFHTFIDGLASEDSRNQWIAYARMSNFPEECTRYLPEILAVRGEREHDSYWLLIENAAKRAHVGPSQLERIYDITFQHLSTKSPLTEEEQKEILALINQTQKRVD